MIYHYSLHRGEAQLVPRILQQEKVRQSFAMLILTKTVVPHFQLDTCMADIDEATCLSSYGSLAVKDGGNGLVAWTKQLSKYKAVSKNVTLLVLTMYVQHTGERMMCYLSQTVCIESMNVKV